MNKTVLFGVIGSILSSALLVWALMGDSSEGPHEPIPQDAHPSVDGDVLELLQFADGYFLRGIYERAEAGYSKIAKGNSEHAGYALYRQSLCFEFLQQFDEAARLKDEYLDRFPDGEYALACRVALSGGINDTEDMP